MTDLSELLERVTGKACPKCNGTGWLFFKCGTPWMCTCNPARNRLRSSALTLDILALEPKP